MSTIALSRRTVLAGCAALPLTGSARGQAQSVLRWGIDYSGTTNPEVAQGFDLLVLEPNHDRAIESLRGPGSRLLGYLGLGEVEAKRPYFRDLQERGALSAPNPNWPDARLVDLRRPEWQQLVVEQLAPGILARGYDGLFFDTLDNAEAMEARDPVANAGMVAGARSLLRAVRERFPRAVIMMNRGYALLPVAAQSIDLILGEAMASRWSFAKKRYELTSAADWNWQAERLRSAKQANPSVQLATLDYWDANDRSAVARLYERERAAGFQPYVATLALDKLLPEPGR